jgi:basic membrane protein A
MKRTIVYTLLGIIAVSLLLGACAKSQPTESSTAPESAEAPASSEAPVAVEKVKVALVTSAGGLGDRSFNDMGYEGFKRAEQELGVEIKVVEPGSVADYQTQLRSVADEGYKLVVGLGSDMLDPIKEVAPEYPDTNFGVVNINPDLPNVATAQFKDHEGSFLAGALAGLMTKTNTIGFLGGMDIPNIQRFLVGYEEGAKYVNPDIKVLTSFAGAWDDPALGKEFAFDLYNQGADIIFAAAGNTGSGVIEAAEETGNYAVGVDSDQDYIAPGYVLSSMVKRVDNAMYDFIKKTVDGTFVPGITFYGLKEGGVGISELKYTKDKIPAEYLTKLDELKDDIINGKIVVTDAAAQ